MLVISKKKVRMMRLLLLLVVLLMTSEGMAKTEDLPVIDKIEPSIWIPAASYEVSNETIALSDGVHLINHAGQYLLTGNCHGQIVIDAKKQEVVLLLDNATVKSSNGPAIYIKAAKTVVLTLADGSENTLEDSETYTILDDDGEPNGTLFSKADLVINGNGILRVNAQYDDGIVSKDSLTITNATIFVTSKNDAVRGKDSVLLVDTTMNIQAGKDGIKSTKEGDASHGWIMIKNSFLNIKAQADGIQAETVIEINGERCQIVSGGGYSAENRKSVSAPVRRGDAPIIDQKEDDLSDLGSGKGLKADEVRILNGTISINSRDDCIHASGNIDISGGSLELASNDDAVHADNIFTLSDGTIIATDCYEGIEAAHIHLHGGEVKITAIDDGWNASGGDSSAVKNGKRKSHDFDITVTGGNHTILSGTDPIDSNGEILISGGVIMACSSNEMKEVPIDYPKVCECKIIGGTLIASGGYNKNTKNASSAENQACLLLKWRENQPKGTVVTLMADDVVLITFSPAVDFKTIIVSFPALQTGTRLTVLTGESNQCTRIIKESVMRFPVTQNTK